MSELPSGWTYARVEQLTELNPKNALGDDDAAGFVPMPLMATGYLEQVRFEKRPWGEIKKSYTHFADGDVVLAKITPCFENGKGGIPFGLPNGIGAGSSEYFVLRPSSAVLAKYLFAYLKTASFLKEGEINMTGSVGHKRVPKDFLLRKTLPLAPLPEQKRIADKLDAVLARVDAARVRLDRVPAVLKHFRRVILSAATSGNLQGELQTADARRNGWIACSLGTVAEVGTGSTPLRSNESFYAVTGTPWITSSATSQRAVTQAEEFVTGEAIKAHRLKIYPVGTLLVAMYGEGKTRGQVTELAIPAAINQACAAVRVDEKRADRRFVRLILEANYFEMRELAEGGNQPNLNLSKIKNFPLTLPSLEAQRKIIQRVESLFAVADRIQAQYERAVERLEKLTPALLAKAFRGELVPQDPNDEPAEKLLQRLKAQTDLLASAGKRAKRSAKALVD
ncbi:type I restriction enzyme S subunit [Paraburkholderia sp. BL6665CI2N2]|uniref:restriction endonuclease subunit S n=1 Tax=Paraburkholderia sp. BL6665CI2N2 TaxID=1938806 RepID=UPI0010663948|nr:restriction endonuclease subunit S [Paraburkholderia sp. BL6665CI2N2]TDY23574.1 type I restriction enzyme S subunit [Paraburkholderia sp. BL6665CI2N2]